MANCHSAIAADKGQAKGAALEAERLLNHCVEYYDSWEE